VTRFADDRVCIVQGRVWASVSGVRVEADALDGLVAEARRLIPSGKATVWWIDPDARPPDLHDRLLALGLGEPADRATLLYSLACTAPTAAGPPEVEVRRVESFDDFLATIELAWDAFATPDHRRDAQRPHLRSEFEAAARAGVPATFLATLDGRPAGSGRSIYSELGVFLIAGAVAPWARGRGVYRALVHARWLDAVERGTPALVTEAMPETSYPILTRLGFEQVCSIRRLEDPRR
jgi:hypothetical protein